MSLNVYLYKTVKCPTCECEFCPDDAVCAYEANITHNLNKMAEAAGIYDHVWRPEEIGITTAEQLIEPLEKAIAEMIADPDRFKQFDSPNGWGSYSNFIPWLSRYLAACREYPNAKIQVSR